MKVLTPALTASKYKLEESSLAVGSLLLRNFSYSSSYSFIELMDMGLSEGES